MTQNLILFGPPGIGKSTIIRSLQNPRYGVVALDIEIVWNNKPLKGQARTLMSLYTQVQDTFGLEPMIVGGAGLDISILYPGFKKVLLFLRQSEYEERRNARNLERPEFAKQGEHLIDNWLRKVKWDYVVSVSKSVDDVIAHLVGLSFIKG